MIMHDVKLAVYGASGRTGEFVVREARRRGLDTIRIGRNPQKLAAGADSASGETRIAHVGDRASLDAALEGASVVVNCAGPFFDTAIPVLDAALRRGIPYLDVAPEQAVVEAMFDTRGAAAQDAGVPVVPAAAFYGGLADLLASALVSDSGKIDEITVAIGLDSWHPTPGTRLTGQRNTVPRVLQRGGRLEVAPNPAPQSEWDFPEPIGPRAVVMQPFSEIITMTRHLNVDTISPWLNLEPLQDLRDSSTPPPERNDRFGRSSQRFVMEVVVDRNGVQRLASARGVDIYHISAPIAVEAAMRLLTGDANHAAGVHAPGAMFDARSFLEGLDVDDFEVAYSEPP